jgi:predicted transcriptional regulator
VEVSEENTEMDFGIVQRVSDLVAAYVSNNRVPVAELPALIASVHAAMTGLTASGASAEPPEPTVEKPTPAQIKKSMRPDGLVSFLDGRAYKTLKRHLTKHGLTPDSYRARFGLPSDYPVVAAAYSERRSNLAKERRFGHVVGRNAGTQEPKTAARGK